MVVAEKFSGGVIIRWRACMRIGQILTASAVSFGLSVAAHGQGVAPPAPPSPAGAPSAMAAPTPPHHLDKCPTNIADFENSDATSKLVERCLGRSHDVRGGRGSDIIWIYSTKDGSLMLVFVFDKTGALTHFHAYSHN